MIVGKFSVRDFICLRTRVASTEDPEVHFNILMNTFCFTVRLGVIDSREGEVIVKHHLKFFCKGRGELWTMIRDYFVVKPEKKVDFMEKEVGYSLCGDGLHQ